MKGIIVYGAGGHSKVVIDAIESAFRGNPISGIVDDNDELHGRKYSGYPVLGGFDELLARKNCRVVIAIALNDARKDLYAKVAQLGYEIISVVHPSAQIARDVTIGPGSMVMALAVLNPGVTIGTGVIVNTGAIIEHDCIVHDFVHIGPGTVFAGAVEVGENSFIGIGARVLPSVQIGAGATVAAGSVVIRDVPDGATVVGVPAELLGGKE